jgi:uncharacterized protein involved in type VI secretion and phage assembly
VSEGVFEELFGPPLPSGLFLGVAVGVVTNTKDPNGWGRLKLKLPWLVSDIETDWVRMASPMAGAGRGLFLLPEVDDEVLVAFEHGSPQVPYVLGVLWNGKDKPPVANDDGKNNIRMIKSRSGHVVRLDDTEGAEKIEIIDKSAKNSIVIDTKQNTVTITCDADLVLESKQGKVVLRGKSVEIAAQSELTVGSNGKAEVKASGPLTLKGAMVNIN